MKFGLGLKYLFPTKFISNDAEGSVKFSYLPIYFTLIVKSNDEDSEGLFLKGDIGYNVYFSSNHPDSFLRIEDKGDLYYAFGAGYEFHSGLVFDITNSRHYKR